MFARLRQQFAERVLGRVHIGRDRLGNVYYVLREAGQPDRRMVEFPKHREFSPEAVPMVWNRWLQGLRSDPPSDEEQDELDARAAMMRERVRRVEEADQKLRIQEIAERRASGGVGGGGAAAAAAAGAMPSIEALFGQIQRSAAFDAETAAVAEATAAARRTGGTVVAPSSSSSSPSSSPSSSSSPLSPSPTAAAVQPGDLRDAPAPPRVADELATTAATHSATAKRAFGSSQAPSPEATGSGGSFRPGVWRPGAPPTPPSTD